MLLHFPWPPPGGSVRTRLEPLWDLRKRVKLFTNYSPPEFCLLSSHFSHIFRASLLSLLLPSRNQLSSLLYYFVMVCWKVLDIQLEQPEQPLLWLKLWKSTVLNFQYSYTKGTCFRWLYLNSPNAAKYQIVGVKFPGRYEKFHFHAVRYLPLPWFTKRMSAYQNISLAVEEN